MKDAGLVALRVADYPSEKLLACTRGNMLLERGLNAKFMCLSDQYTFHCSDEISCNLYLFILIQETMENVKKCKSFLSTLIKLASSGKQSTETAANVKELVQNLLVRSSGETLCLRACDLQPMLGQPG